MRQQRTHVDGLGCWCAPYIELRRCLVPSCDKAHIVEVHHTGRVAVVFKSQDGHP